MALASMSEVLRKAQEGHYAVGAFNAENMEMVQAIIAAAEELRAPVIIQTTPSTIKYASAKMYQSMVAAEAEKATVPVVMHLDHGSSYELCVEAIESGYTSVMIDGSKLPFEDNMELGRKVEEYAQKYGVDVEAELGCVGGKEDIHEVAEKDALYTDPQQAKKFAETTGVQSLAVAIGTAHGFYKGEPKLDFDRLREIRETVDIPLVLHGASGVPDEKVTRAIELGICKVNFATELRVAYSEGVREALKNQEMFDPKKYGTVGREKVKELVMHKIRVCKSNGRC